MTRYSSLTLWVPGLPIPQGSMRSPRAGVVLHNSPELKSWRDSIAWAAKDEWRGQPLLDQSVYLTCGFIFPKPARSRHPHWRDTAPDLDKLIRAVGDALEGVVLKNDARIVSVTASKKWTGERPLSFPEPGAYIRIETTS